MIRLRSMLLAAATAAVAVALVPASAQAHSGDFELGFGLGATELDENVADDRAFRGDFRLGYHLNDVFQLEGQLGAQETDLEGDDILLTTFTVNALANFHVSEVAVPYLLAGIGHANLEIDFGDIAVDDDSLAYQAGVGLRLFPGRGTVGARFEALVLREETFDEWSTHYAATVGVTWRIGRR